MGELTDLPKWLGTALIGAVIAALGFVATKLFDWVSSRITARRERRARLVELLALLRAGDVAFKIQSENRDRLRRLIKARDPTLYKEAVGFDELFARRFRTMTMTPKERELHAMVRTITIHTIYPLNERILAWIQADREFKVARPRKGFVRKLVGEGLASRLAIYLAQLEAHLLLWRAKYEAWIPGQEDRALVYLGDEEHHGLPFPFGGTRMVARMLGVDLEPYKPKAEDVDLPSAEGESEPAFEEGLEREGEPVR